MQKLQELDLDFLGKRVPAIALSLLFVLASVASMATRSMNFGIDFTGGVLIEVGYPEAVELTSIRQTLERIGFDDSQVQHFGTSREVLIRLAPGEATSDEVSQQVMAALREDGSQVEMRRVEFVGPQVGEQLTEQGGLAMLFALIMILIYIWLRFEWKFAVGAIAALVHDSVLVLGLFSVLGLPFDLTVLAAVLAVIGYSLNDTIVVFDRIRENFHNMRKGGSELIMNRSINQTLSRTIITGMTTLLVLFALYILGGEVIRGFSIALITGVIVGTYSSIFVASAVALMLGVSRQDFIESSKEDPELEKMP